MCGYNVEKYIGRAIKSVAIQEYNNYELTRNQGSNPNVNYKK